MVRHSLITVAISLGLASAQQDLVSVLQSEPDLSTLTAIVPKLPEVQEWIGAATNLTLLLPTNDAISALPADSWEGKIFSETDIDGIAAILSLHVINGVFRSTDFKETPTFAHSILTEIEPIGGKAVANVTGGQNIGYYLNGSDATILSGYWSTSKVIKADIAAGNNLIIHKIDSVLRLPLNVSATAEKLGLEGAAKALEATGLTETADTIADITIFVPNNEAFQAVESQIANLSAQEVTGILSYHAIAGAVLFSSDLTNTTVQTLAGQNVTITVGADGSVWVDKAKVVTPNVILSNGVAHVIDSVLIPGDAEGAAGGSGATAGGYGPPASSGGNSTNATTSTTPTPTPYTGEAAGRLRSVAATAGVLLIAVMLAM